MKLKLVVLAAVICATTCQGAFAVPQVADDSLWTDNLAWNCAVLAFYAPEKSAAHADMNRVAAVALGEKITHISDPVFAGLETKHEDFWQGANFGSAMNFVDADLFARLPPGSGPDLLGKEAAQLYDEKGCAQLGR